MNKILKVVLTLLIGITAILIGTPIKYNCLPINIISIFIGIGFIIYQHFIKKEKIFTNKLDFAVLILCISPLIPIISNQYISLENSIIYLLKYISCLIVYLLSKYLVQENSKNLEFFTNVIIACSVILCIVGIDNMTTKIFCEGLEALKLPYVVNIEGRMFSSLGYANSFAIILAVASILTMDRIANSNSKYVAIYAGALFINLFCLILTFSRGVLLFFALFLLIYLVINKNKSKNIIVVGNLIINGILSLGNVIIWNHLKAKESYILIWIITLAIFIGAIALHKILKGLYRKIEKISIKVYCVTMIVVGMLIIIVIGIGFQLVTPLSIFQKGTTNNEVKYKISNIKPNTEYILKFDIEAKSVLNNVKNYSIIIEEENKYYDKVAEHEVSFNNYTGIQEIKFTTSDTTIEFALLFENRYKSAQLGLTVNSLTINEEKHPLKYLYLPTKLAETIRSISLSHKSAWERGVFYKDAIKIIKDNYLFGLGGASWKDKYIEVQEYDYSTTEIHNYLLQIFMDYGIVGVVSFIVTIVLVLIQIVKDRKKDKLGIGIAFSLLIAHSMLDFNMSFFYIMIIAFVLLGMIVAKDEKEAKERASQDKLIFSMILLILVISLGFSGLEIYHANKIKNRQIAIREELEKQNYDEVIEQIKQLRKTEKYRYYYYLKEIDYAIVNQENLEYIYDMIKEQPIVVDVKYNRQRCEIIEKILENSQEQEIKRKFAQLVVEENEEIVSRIEDKEKNRLLIDEIKLYLSEQERLYEISQKTLKDGG